jgi:hypothetical protein
MNQKQEDIVPAFKGKKSKQSKYLTQISVTYNLKGNI